MMFLYLNCSVNVLIKFVKTPLESPPITGFDMQYKLALLNSRTAISL